MSESELVEFTHPGNEAIYRAWMGIQRVGPSPLAILKYLDGLEPNVLAYLLIWSRSASG